MEPFTHALTSLALARAGRGRLPRFGAAMMVAAGIAPDLDYASYFAGPAAFLQFHRTVLHSLAGAVALSGAITGLFCTLDRKWPASQAAQERRHPPLAFPAAFAACAAGAGGHLLLDVASGSGLELLWPFHARWFAWNLAANLDPWILALLIAGFLLPLLFRLVNEEVGDRKRGNGASRAAIFTLALLAAYLGLRARLRSEAIDLLLSREYHGRVPLAAGAFPESSAPFAWRGLAVTDDTIEEAEVSLAPGADFDPDRSLTHYKPEESPALRAGQQTAAAARFLVYARFPLASVTRIEDGCRFEIHDLRFASGDENPANIFVRVDFNSSLQAQRAGFFFASSPNP